MSSTPKKLRKAEKEIRAGHFVKGYELAREFVVSTPEADDSPLRDRAISLMVAASSFYMLAEEVKPPKKAKADQMPEIKGAMQ